MIDNGCGKNETFFDIQIQNYIILKKEPKK